MPSFFTCAENCAYESWQELKGQPFRDDPFTETDWKAHGTWRRYIPEPNVSGLVVISLAPVWGWSVLVSTLLGLYATYAEPAGWPNVSTHDDLLAIFMLTSFALSLLMLFKTTSSYGRWWEARTLLGSGYITVRSVLRLCMSYVGRQHPDLIPPIFRWTAAIMPALAAHVRGRNHYLEEHLQAVMHPGELRWLLERGEGRSNPAVAALQVLSRLLDRADLPVIERQQIEMLLSHCDVVVGASERIRSQPIPRAWNRHTHRFLLFYITFLPFAFWPLYKWYTLPIMAVLAFLLCGVENIGVQCEEPFRVLPLNHICAGTTRALRFMMNDEHESASMAAFAAGISTLNGSPTAARGVAMTTVTPPAIFHMDAGSPQAALANGAVHYSSNGSGGTRSRRSSRDGGVTAAQVAAAAASLDVEQQRAETQGHA
ncbi:hypothetical protein ACK3TF_000036 [Chlorella vulgaris]